MKNGTRHIALAGAVLLLIALPSAVAAHSELVTATPEDGATVPAGPIDIIGTFSEELAPNSHMDVRDASGTVVGQAAIDEKTMRIGLEGLQPGRYSVRWTTVTADDNGVLRGSWSFTVAAAASPSLTPTSSAVSAPPSASAAASPSSSAVASPVPSPSSGGTNTTGTSSTDVLLPILAAILVIGLLGLALIRRRTPTRR
jgi:copper resistance protein C